jgi:hypothetical protein
MSLESRSEVEVSSDLLDAIRSFPVEREVEHCGARMTVSPFDFYADCPRCGSRVKLRSFAAAGEIEDVFDAVFEWMSDPNARRAAEQRCQEFEADRDLP